MSVKQMGKVWEHEFPHNQMLILLALADHADDLGRNIFPSKSRIAWKTGYNSRSVQRIIKELKDEGVLKVAKRATRYRPTEYFIDWNCAKPKRQFVSPDEQIATDVVSGETTEATRGDTGVVSGETQLCHPNHHINHHKEPSKNRQFNTKPFVYVLAQVTGIDEKLINWGHYSKEAKKLNDAGYSVEQVAAIFQEGGAWYKQDWRGKKGQKPTVKQIRETIKELSAVKTERYDPDRYTKGTFSKFIKS